MSGYDVAVVGAGIVGLAHAYFAARRGKRVVVIERDAQANGASIRNFGFITVTGQQAGDCWTMARRSRDVWTEIAPKAGIEILHRGLIATARRPEAEAVIDAFLATDMGVGCRRLSREAAMEFAPVTAPVTAALHSPHELRVESKTAIPALARWLAEVHGVAFRWGTAVHAVEPPAIRTSAGRIDAETAIICPGDDFTALFADRIAAYGLTRCKLQMLRVRPGGTRPVNAGVMSDLGLARYLGYAELPAARALSDRLDAEQTEHRANGIHLIVVRSADGSLVVGDSHHYSATPDPFAPSSVADLILDEMDSVLDLGARRVTERWVGTYASAADRWRLTDAPDNATRIVIVTCGAGASTAFGIAEETIANLFD